VDRKTIWFLIALFVVISGGAFSTYLRRPVAIENPNIDLEAIPLTIDGWTANAVTLDPEDLRLLDVNRYILREYVDTTGFSIWLFVGYFNSQKFGSGVHSPRNCLPGSGWEIVNSYPATLPGDPDLRVNRMDIALGNARQTMYYWFVTRAGVIRGEFSLKGNLVKNALLGRPTDAAFVRINFESGGYPAESVEIRVGDFVRKFEKEVYSALPF